MVWFEQARSNRTKCVICQKTIPLGSDKILELSSGTWSWYNYHANCFMKAITKIIIDKKYNSTTSNSTTSVECQLSRSVK